MKIRYVGSRAGLNPERNIEIGEVFTVFQVGESYFHVLGENGAPVTLYEDEVALVNPPLNPLTPGKPEWMGGRRPRLFHRSGICKRANH